MRAFTFVELGFFAALLSCSGRQTTIGSSLGEEPPTDDAAAAPASASAAPTDSALPPKVPAPTAKLTGPEPPPPPDPALVKALVEKTGESAPTDNLLHLRLEVTPRPAGELWLVAVVNRGTESTRVRFDLRRLTLTLTPPEDEKKPRARWQKKPVPVVCKLPDGFGGQVADDEPYTLEPGEGLVQTFDPRLYCISPGGDSRLATGQTVTPKLGYPPKPPRTVWKQGKKTEEPAQQVAPFIAEPTTAPAELTAANDPRIKELVAPDVLVTAGMTDAEAEEDPTQPLKLRLVRGSDATNELSATAVVEVRARKKTQLYFRRELVSYIVHGPDGIRGCDPQPDDRAPDRQAYSTLAAGQSIAATSLLTELCPKFTFGRPGLYLVSARLDAERTGAEFGLTAFTGRLESGRQALVRIRVGDLPPLPPPEPLHVRVGQ
ncbi:MAG: hypothetical protein K0R38_3846 [Polyangiaceae bacterium]|jgi:hypothetical protein|nr:hypothetical protein [Polyangiaceae bacterium]